MKKIVALLLVSAVPAASFAQNITSGLVAQYTFESGAGDVSGNGNNATPAGLYQYVSTGLVGGAIHLSGDNSLFYAGGGHLLLPTFSTAMNSGFTVSLWAKDEVLGGQPSIEEHYIGFGIGDQPIMGISLNSEAKKILFFMNGGLGAVAFEVSKTLNFATDLSRWKHLALTYTPGKMTAYFDGVKIGEGIITVNVFPITRAALGRHYWSGGAGSSARMSVTLDNVRIYNRALTDADVQQIYITDALPVTPAPTITTQPVAQSVIELQSTTFRVAAASNTPSLYQWLKNGVPISGALDSSYTISAVKTTDAATYSVTVTNAGGTVTSAGATLAVVPANPGRLINLATLGTGSFTMGFVVGGGTSKNMLIRAVGPTLKLFNVSNAATQTSLTLYSGATVLGLNSGWSAAPNAAQMIGAGGSFTLTAGSTDSAILTNLAPGNYTAQATGNGAVLVEVYEVP